MPQKKKRILILDGPNLNLVGVRNPKIYGTINPADYINQLVPVFHDVELIYMQTNHEGGMIDLLQNYGFGKADGIVLNAGGYTHTSVALRDCVEVLSVPVIEVHLSDTLGRESFRRHSYLTEVCKERIGGLGVEGYKLAIEKLLKAGVENASERSIVENVSERS